MHMAGRQPASRSSYSMLRMIDAARAPPIIIPTAWAGTTGDVKQE